MLEAVRTLESLGARITKVTLPEVEPGIVAWMTICAADAAAAHERTYPAKAADYGPGFRSFLEVGAAVRGQDYAKAHMVREGFANRFQELFDRVDVVACPSMSVASLPASAMAPDARGLVGPNPLLHFTGPFNLSRNPTLSQPCGKSPAGPPPSLQLIGRHLGESTLIQTGRPTNELPNGTISSRLNRRICDRRNSQLCSGSGSGKEPTETQTAYLHSALVESDS